MFEIRLVKDPERRLQKVGTTEIRWDIGNKCIEFESVDKAKALMKRFNKWAWSGTEIAKMVIKKQDNQQ